MTKAIAECDSPKTTKRGTSSFVNGLARNDDKLLESSAIRGSVDNRSSRPSWVRVLCDSARRFGHAIADRRAMLELSMLDWVLGPFPETPEDRAIREEGKRIRKAFPDIDFDHPSGSRLEIRLGETPT